MKNSKKYRKKKPIEKNQTKPNSILLFVSLYFASILKTMKRSFQEERRVPREITAVASGRLKHIF